MCVISTELPEVNSVFLSQERKLHTTRSWEFLGMDDAMSKATARNDSSERSLREKAKYGKGTVIGMLDSGGYDELCKISTEVQAKRERERVWCLKSSKLSKLLVQGR